MGGQTPMEMDMNMDLTEETKKTSRGGTYISCMQSGGGEDSYANISRPQNFIFRVYTRSHLSEALDYLCTSPHILKLFQRVDKEQDGEERPLVAALSPSDFRSKEPPSFPRLKVADLGCSHGRNTLDYAAYILLELQTRLLKGCSITASQTREDATVLEIEYLFSDLPENDFNSLFRSLPSLLQGIADQAHHACKIFTGGVPGSFHGPLFPTSSLHFATSAYSLHWLSQVPPEVLDKNSPAWNGGSVWLHGERPKVMKAFASQYRKDMRCFFQQRARELVKGGVLFLLLPCRAELHPSGALYDPRLDLWSGFFESAWSDMVCQGIVSEEERDLFNIPFYMCHEEELLSLLEEFVDVFRVLKMETMKGCVGMPTDEEEKLLEDPPAFGRFWANFIASLVRPMVREHIGEERSVQFFARLESLITERANKCAIRRNTLLVTIIQRL